jgi:hypothetical protein
MDFISDIRKIDYNKILKDNINSLSGKPSKVNFIGNSLEVNFVNQIDPRNHSMADSFRQVSVFPPHIPRKNSNDSKFNKVKHFMITEADMPCFICNISKSQIKPNTKVDKIPLEMELHHFFIEWAFSEGVDLHKWNTKMVPMVCKFNYLEYYFDSLEESKKNNIIQLAEKFDPKIAEILKQKDLNKKYKMKQKLLTFKTLNQVIEWAQSDIFNMMPLCSFHHRKPEVGIHKKSFPLWISTMVLEDSLVKSTEQLEELDYLLHSSKSLSDSNKYDLKKVNKSL